MGKWAVLINLVLFAWPVSAQERFNLGIYGYDATGPVVEFSEHEQNLIRQLHANYVAEMTVIVQDEMIRFCAAKAGSIKVELVHDPAYRKRKGPYYPIPQDRNNTVFWAYLSTNKAVSDISYEKIDRFFENIAARYDASDRAGIGTIRVAHEGTTDNPDHWPFIKYACNQIDEYFGESIKSVAIHNVFQWSDNSTLQEFFQSVDNLDIYQHELYPFHVATQWPNPQDSSVFTGKKYQEVIIDKNYIRSCELTRQALKKSGNSHTKWEMIIQTLRQYYGGHFFRRPTESEIWLQAFLAISRGAKGIHSYVYRTNLEKPQWGLVDNSHPRQKIEPTFDHIAALYQYLSKLGPELADFSVDTAFTWQGDPYRYVQSIRGDSTEEDHRTIEICFFETDDNAEYFMLINRRCNQNVAGDWVDAFPQHISIQFSSFDSNNFKIRDLYSNEEFEVINSILSDFEIKAGRGRVLKLMR